MMVCDKVGNVTVAKLGGTAEAYLSLCPFVGDEGFFYTLRAIPQQKKKGLFHAIE